MRIFIKKRSGKLLAEVNVDSNATLESLKTDFYKIHGFYPERQRFTLNAANGLALRDGLLSQQGVIQDSVLFFKDLGAQISWRLVFVIEYFGPLLIFPFFYFFPNLVYGEVPKERSYVQKVSLALVLFHYFKRELETLFVHRFSNATMPIARLPINCIHYWFIFATCVGYYLMHPRYHSNWKDNTHVNILAAVMIIFELLNLKTHIILRNLRPRGTKIRAIPHGWGFGISSCANYTWEILAWLTFAILTQCLTSWIFLVVATFQMTEWALKKHNNYVKEFVDYPSCRFAILPPII